MAAPDRPAIRLWLSLVGMPKMEAPTLYTTMDSRDAHRAMRALDVSAPKSTMLLMVEATELLIWVMTKTPRKLNTALIQMAWRTSRQRVVTQVAMALGASVQPLTKMTPRVKTTVMIRMGLPASCPQNEVNDRSIKLQQTPFGRSGGAEAPGQESPGTERCTVQAVYRNLTSILLNL